MSRFYLKLLCLYLPFLCAKSLIAKEIIDCRVMTGDMTKCNPYGKKLHYVKEVTYDRDEHKLIIVKRLSSLKKKPFMKVISVKDMMTEVFSVKDMMTEYLYVDDSQSFKESDAVVLKSKKIITQPSKTIVAQGYYDVVKGDSLSKISKKLGLKMSVLKKLNGLKDTSTLAIGQKLKTPFEQRVVDALVKTEYTVEKNDTLLSIAKMFNLPAKDIVTFNHIKNATTVQEGKVLKLPLPYILNKFKAKSKNEEAGYKLDVNAFGTNRLRVTATAYTSHANQTDDTPFLAAWNNRLRPGMKIIAVSRDLLSRYGMRNGTKVRIDGLKGLYRVRDKMNKRYKKRIDVYMGLNLKKALKWGRRSVMIYW